MRHVKEWNKIINETYRAVLDELYYRTSINTNYFWELFDINQYIENDMYEIQEQLIAVYFGLDK